MAVAPDRAVRLYLERVVSDGYEADPDKRILSTKKANYGRVGFELSMTWQDGLFRRDVEPQGLDKLAAGAKAERVFLSLLDEFTAQGRHVSATPSVTYAPALFAKHPKAEGCTKRALASAMEALLSNETVVIGQHGTGAKARSHLQRAGCNPPGNAGCNEGATFSPYTPRVAPAPEGGVHADPDTFDPEMWT